MPLQNLGDEVSKEGFWRTESCDELVSSLVFVDGCGDSSGSVALEKGSSRMSAYLTLSPEDGYQIMTASLFCYRPSRASGNPVWNSHR